MKKNNLKLVNYDLSSDSDENEEPVCKKYVVINLI